MIRRARFTAATILLAFLAAGGCIHPQSPPPPPPRSLNDVQTVLQTNAAKAVGYLASNIWVKARFKDDAGRLQSENLEGTLLYREPGDLRVDLKHGLAEKVLEIGSNPEEFWVWIEPHFATMFWGRHRNAGRACIGKMPVKPDQILDALGIGGLPKQEGLFGPVFRQEERTDVLAFFRRDAHDGWLFDREYFISRIPPYLIEEVLIYDADGGRAVVASLSDYRLAWPDGPLVAHHIEIRWPKEDALLCIEAKKFDRPSKPSPRAFEKPTRQLRLPAGVREVIQVDRDCDLTPSSRPAARARSAASDDASH